MVVAEREDSPWSRWLRLLTTQGAISLLVLSHAVASGQDSTPPSVPAGVSAVETSETAALVSWSASTDNVGVAGYQVFRDGALLGTSTGTDFSDAGPLDKYRSYEYAVSAYDAAGNYSAASTNFVFAYRRFPFTLQWNDATAGTITDMSGLSPGPASTWITTTNGRLCAGATPTRFFGVNAVFNVCFPPYNIAEELAARLAKLGVNCVRFHHMDTRFPPDGIFANLATNDLGYKRTLDAGQVDKLDYFIAQLKSRGIYADLNLHVGRTYAGYPTNGAPGYFKGIDVFMPGMIDLQKEYARDLLTHVNPYTGNAYTNEPAVAFIEISNEDGLIAQWHNGTFGSNLHTNYTNELTTQWNQWLASKYTDTPALANAWAATGATPYGTELLTNGSWSSAFGAPWSLEVTAPAAASASVVTGGAPDGGNALRINITASGSASDVELCHTGIVVSVGQAYTASFWARADTPRTLRVGWAQQHSPRQSLGDTTIALIAEWRQFTVLVPATATDADARFVISGLGSETGPVFFAGLSAKTGNTFIGSTSAAQEYLGAEMLSNSVFEAGFVAPWAFQVVSPAVANKQLLAATAPDGSTALEINVVTAGGVQYYQYGHCVTNGQPYTLSLWAKSEQTRQVTIGLERHLSPWGMLGSSTVTLTTNWQPYSVTVFATATETNTRLKVGSLGSVTGRMWFATHSLRLGSPGIGLPGGETLGTASILRKDQFASRTRAARRDWMQFLWETERAYWTGMSGYIKNTLGARSLIIGTQTSYSPAPIQGELDVVDSHAYWRHPSWPGVPWDANNWYIYNEPMAGTGSGGTLPGMAQTRIAGKPFVCTEYGHPAPSTLNAETLPLLASYAALQGWDAVFCYNYLDTTNWSQGYYNSWFNYGREPAKLISFPLAAAIMRRGDVSSATRLVRATVTPDIAMEKVGLTDAQLGTTDFGLNGLLAQQNQLTFATGAAVQLSAPFFDTNATAVVSDTGHLTWDIARHLVTLRAPLAKAVIGSARQQTYDLGDGVVVTPGATMQSNDWCALSLLVKDGTSFQASGSRILVSAGGYCDNHKTIWSSGKGPTNSTSMIASANWGRAPSLLEGIPATVSFAWPARHLSVWALDTNGVRKASVPVTDVGGKGTFVIGREYQTAWYEAATYANAAPVVQITTPADGANFSPPPATITIQASASDSDGAITKVEFFNGATKLGETNAAPYNFVWTNVAQGSYTLTARATDDESTPTTSSAVNITVGVIINTGATLPGGTWNSGYSQTLSASGGTGPYTWTLLSGALPRGMGLSSAGVLSGTPNQGGAFNFTVQAADANGVSATREFSLTILVPLTIVTTSPLSNGVTGVFYSNALAAIGGTPGYAWTVSGGALPGGLTLSTDGLLSGTPTNLGTFNFTALVTDAVSASASRNLSITMIPPLTLLSVVSRKTHGATGVFDMVVNLDPGLNPTVEPRRYGPTQVLFTFNKATAAADGLLSANEFVLTNATYVSASVASSNVTLNLTNVVDVSKVTVVLTGLCDLAGNALAGTNAVLIRALYGDVNRNGRVNVADLQAVKYWLGTGLTASSFLSDLNLNGVINVADQQAVKNAQGREVPLGDIAPGMVPLEGAGVVLPVTLGEALGAPWLAWSSDGDREWAPAVASDGTVTAMSGSIGDLNVSWVETVVTGPGSLSFEWRVSSELNGDFLTFSVDGVEQAGRLSGETGWRTLAFSIGAGRHRLTWTYAKNRAGAYGYDAAWLRQVVWQTTAR